MFEMLLIAAACILSVIGMCEIVHIICVFVLRPEKKAHQWLCVFPDKGLAERQIALSLHEAKWYGNDYAAGLIIFSRSLEEGELQHCRERFIGEKIIFTKDFSNIIGDTKNVGNSNC